MRAFSLIHLSDAALLRGLAALVLQNRSLTAALLAHIAEVDARRLFAIAGYASMHAYCVGELHLSDDAAYKRIQAARAARQHPVLFAAVADGRLHLTAARLLAPHVTAGNVEELIAAATHQRSNAIEDWLARRFPSAVREIPTRVRLLPPAPPSFHAAAAPAASAAAPLAAGQVGGSLFAAPSTGAPELAAGQVAAASATPEPPALLPAQARYLLQVAIGGRTHDKLRRAQALLSHTVRAGDIAAVLDRALDALIEKCEKRRFAVGVKPRPRTRPATGRRTIPAEVRRAVWTRDGGRCTFVGTAGHRCGTRAHLQFDHADPVARGGRATVERLRLRCRAHNQLEAERVFGPGFMAAKRRKRGSGGPAELGTHPGSPERIEAAPMEGRPRLEAPRADGGGSGGG